MTTATLQLSFRAGAAGAPTPPDPVARCGLMFHVELDATSPSAPARPPLSDLLQIHFAPHAPHAPCVRLIFDGINPIGHAPLEIGAAGYWGSSCPYAGPDAEWLVYAEAPTGAPDPLLVIQAPSENLYSCFRWPERLYHFDPELTEAEDEPVVTLVLDQLVGLDGETETGVRLSMRLILIDPSVTGETIVKESNYERAPHFTGSGETINARRSDDDPDTEVDGLISATGTELVTAVSAPGVYDLYWRIYHGSGDMLYQLQCDGSAVGEFYRDRRNAGLGGGFGLFETTDLKVATVRVRPYPWPWMLTDWSGGAADLAADTILRTPDPAQRAGTHYWFGTGADGAPVAVTWDDSAILLGGRLVETATHAVLAAALHRVTDPTAYPGLYPLEDGDPGWEALIWLTAAGEVWYRRLRISDAPVLIGTRTLPSYPITSGQTLWVHAPSVHSYHFSPDGRSLLAYASMLQPKPVTATSAVLLAAAATAGDTTIDLVWIKDGGIIRPALNQPLTLGAGADSAVNLHEVVFAMTATLTSDLVDRQYWTLTLRTPLQFSWAETTGLYQAYGRDYDVAGVPGPPAWYDGEFGGALWSWENVFDAAANWVLEQHWISATESATSGTDNSSVDTSSSGDCEIIETQTVDGTSGSTKWIEILAAAYWSTENVLVARTLRMDQVTSSTTTGTRLWQRCDGYDCTYDYNLDNVTTVTDHDLRARLMDNGVQVWEHVLRDDSVTTLKTSELRTGYAGGCNSSFQPLDTRTTTVSAQAWSTLRLSLDPRAPAHDLRLVRGVSQAASSYTVTDGVPSSSGGEVTWSAPADLLSGATTWILPAVEEPPPSAPGISYAYLAALFLHGDGLRATPHPADGTLLHVNGAGLNRAALLIDSTLTPVDDLDDLPINTVAPLTPRLCWLAADYPAEVQPADDGCVGVNPPAVTPPTAAALIAAHNAWRGAYSLSTLTENAALTAAILSHVEWLKAGDLIALPHTGAGGTTPLDRAIAAGYVGASTTAAGENLALGHHSVPAVMAAWDISPEDAANLANPDWADIGVAIVAEDDGEGYWWGVLFGVTT